MPYSSPQGRRCHGAPVLPAFEQLPLFLLQWACFGILLGMAALYRSVFFLTLKIKERKSR